MLTPPQPHRRPIPADPGRSGKTTALRAACAGWEAAERRVIRPPGGETCTSTRTNRTAQLARNRTADPFYNLSPGDVLLLNEAGMAGTLLLRTLLTHARTAGVQLRLVGDPYQLSAVESGGAFRHLDRVITGQVKRDGVELHDGITAGKGDWVVTRRNQRLVTARGSRDFVKNRDRWTFTTLHADKSVTLTSHAHRGTVCLPATYVERDVELSYATTAHGSQGASVATAHVLVRAEDTRESLYVAASRARSAKPHHALRHHR